MSKEEWGPMEVTEVGRVGDVLQLGQGKLSQSVQPDHGQETDQSPPGQEK